MIPLKMNDQPAEKPVRTDGKLLDVHSVFLTIQGEGPFSGHPSVFVRLAGCNLQCKYCDTEYTAGRGGMLVEEIVAKVRELSVRPLGVTPTIKVPVYGLRTDLVVLTGGEPFRQSIGPLTKELLAAGYRVQVETNGTLFLSDFPWGEPGVTIVCSPKTHINKQLKPRIDHLKYVVDHRHVDPGFGLPTLALGTSKPEFAGLPKDTGLKADSVWLSPMDTGDEEENRKNVEACVRSALDNGYRVSLQIHKLMGVP